MKLQCEVIVVNRLLPTLNVASAKRRPVKSTLALGKEPKDNASFFILHFSALNKLGTRYRVTGNVEQVFTKFCSEGKATVRFKNPPNDLCIKCESAQLKAFLKVLKLALDGNTETLKIFSLSALSATEVKAAPTRLTIVDMSRYPLKGLPKSLTHLQLTSVGLHTFRREILTLRGLQSLDLSDNNLQRLPPELGSMPRLVELHLGQNDLGNTERPDWRWLEGAQIQQNLKLLDLNSNNIGPMLPHTVARLAGLVTLKVDRNRLRNLPRGIGRISRLQYLSASDNELSSLPAPLRRLRLQQVDLSSNPFLPPPAEEGELTFRLGSLTEIAGAAVLSYKLYYARNIIPFTLVEYLNSSNYCGVCGAPTLDHRNLRRIKSPIRELFTAVTLDRSADSYITFDCYCCSFACSKLVK